MRGVLLIASNFAREQRWPILLLILGVLALALMGLTVDLQKHQEDALFLFKELSIYGIAFSVFFGGSAINTERRSRRILAVLAKSISRSQYVLGLLAGVALAAGLYCFTLGVTGTWLLGDIGFSRAHLWYLMVCLLSACLLSASVSVLYSTFLNPFLATIATALSLTLPAGTMRFAGAGWQNVLPVHTLMDVILQAMFVGNWKADWVLVGISLAQAALICGLAAWIFTSRDVAVAID